MALALKGVITRIPIVPAQHSHSLVYSARTLRLPTLQKSVEKWISQGISKSNTIRTEVVTVVVIRAQAEAIIVVAIGVHSWPPPILTINTSKKVCLIFQYLIPLTIKSKLYQIFRNN